MGVVIGIDVGGSTTKIVGFREGNKLIEPIAVTATDPVTSVYGAFGKFTTINDLELSDIDIIAVTGVGAAHIDKPPFGLKCVHVSEFDSVGIGGLYLSKLDKAIVVSMGTGTALVSADNISNKIEYLGGTGVGGGTLLGLSRKLIGSSDAKSVYELAEEGDLSHIDLMVSDLTRTDYPGMSSDITAANFGNLSDRATEGDLALGLINMIFETIAMLSLFASRSKNNNNIILTGTMTTVPQAKETFDNISKIFGANFIIPDFSQFATAIGAALVASRSNYEK